MSNSIFQGVILQLKEVSDRAIGVIDNEGCVVSSTELTLLGERWVAVLKELTESGDQTVVFENRTFRGIFNNSGAIDYAVFCDGADGQSQLLCNMAFIALSDAKCYYEEKHDRGTFIKNIIMDNILPGDVYVRAKELRFATDAPRAVFLARQLGQSEVTMVDALSGLFPDKHQDFVLSVNETDVAIIKQLNAVPTNEELEKIARAVENVFTEELGVACIIGIGTVASHLWELADAYKEAQTAIEVGKVFDTEKSIINYENLGIGRLIYQLPTTLCEIFLTEVFKKNSIETLDQETLFTINKFFENNLNVSETSRKLFVHRNTLVYRLEKIKKLTGLDLRQFDHAIVFKVALMVRKYLSSREAR